MNTNYSTSNLVKANALFTALVMAGFQTVIGSCSGHVHLTTAASEEQFKAIRASIGIPSSNPDAVVDDGPSLADYAKYVIPDHIPHDWKF